MVKRRLYILLSFIFLLANILIAQDICDTDMHHDACYGLETDPPRISNSKFPNEIKYPQTAVRDSVQGKVVVKFWMDSIGNTSKYEIIKSVRYDLDNEALRLIKLLKFKPAMQDGKSVGVWFSLPITFKLDAKKNGGSQNKHNDTNRTIGY